MLNKNDQESRKQIQFVSTDSLVPENHLLRDIERAIDFSFIYDLVKDKYSQDQGRPSLDPVTLIKIPLIQYLYGISSNDSIILRTKVGKKHTLLILLSFFKLKMSKVNPGTPTHVLIDGKIS